VRGLLVRYGELKECLDQAILPSLDDFRSGLAKAWTALDAAKTAKREAKAAVDAASIDFEKGQKELAELKKTNRDRILAAMKEFNPNVE
jgi:hypothetical protein